jgi:hypothetical protein
LSVTVIPRECDLVYEQYGVRYGLDSRALFNCLAGGGTPIVIVNDVRIVADIKAMLGPLTRCLFVFRTFPEIDEFVKLAVERGVPDAESEAKRRLIKADAIYRIYIENIHLFDHALINAGTVDELRREVEVVIRGIARGGPVWPLRRIRFGSTARVK